MIREYALMFRLCTLGFILFICILSAVLTIGKSRKIGIPILLVLIMCTVFFFMFFYGVYVKVDKINETSVAQIWIKLVTFEYTYDPDISELNDWQVYSYSEVNDRYSVLIQKWETNDKIDLSYWCEAHNYRANGMEFIYNLLKIQETGKDFDWVIAPLSADRSKDDLYAFTGWYNGYFIIKKNNQYVRCAYSIKTNDKNISAFMCIPPKEFELKSFVFCL